MEVYHIKSISGFWYSCRSAVAFFTVNVHDVNKLGASRLLKFQLWHGIPLKKIVYDNKFEDSRNKSEWFKILLILKSKLFPYNEVYGKWDAIASTSPHVSSIFRSAFKINHNKIFVTGSPRGDILLKKEIEQLPIVEKVSAKVRFSKTIGYFPTHRNDASGFMKYLNKDNLNKVAEILEQQDAVLFIKLHYYNLGEEFSNKHPRIVFLQEEELPDINYLLPWIDILITDYSSVFYDYLLLNRPIIFAPFDLEQYLSNDRELYGKYEDLTPGPKCFNWDDIIQNIKDICAGKDEFHDIRQEAIKIYHSHRDTNNCKRVVEVVKELLQ